MDDETMPERREAGDRRQGERRAPLVMLHPHVVDLPEAKVVTRGRGKQRETMHAGNLEDPPREVRCPDCTRGVVSRGTDLICAQLATYADMTTTGNLKAGRIVACGEGLNDG